MHAGIARGGPRAGVKITASITWDGKVEKPNGSESQGTGAIASQRRYYPGRYFWEFSANTWVWETAEERKLSGLDKLNATKPRGYVRD